MSQLKWVEPVDTPVPMPVTSFDRLPHTETKDRKGRVFAKRFRGVPLIDRPTLVDLYANGAYYLRRTKKRKNPELRIISEAEAKKKLAALEEKEAAERNVKAEAAAKEAKAPAKPKAKPKKKET
jgi:hypothetical protein